ncbi:hypothetical protein BGZ63DRAFT_357289 [Mariannaea sp. PMI_226]|nr:hypothetical protein BGZ63DRAFT_357289 [Mariannaea sp. PMI_226]
MPSSHRRLIHPHDQQILNDEPRELAPEEARSFSYSEPSLIGGLHTISIKQTITAPVEEGSGSTARRVAHIDPLSQSFVMAPRFSLPPNAVDSVYPTPGISVEHTVLPHIVLKDPHLPWSRAPSEAHVTPNEDAGNVQSCTTWLALLVFSLDELQLSQTQIQHVLQRMPEEVDRKQSETCTLKMLSRQTPGLGGIQGLVNTTGLSEKLDAKDSAEVTEVIILPGSLFTDLFVDAEGPADKLNVSGYNFMAHARNIATDGMPNAGAESDEAICSVVISRRTGPIVAEEPSMMIAHLVSLSWDQDMPVPNNSDLVAMTSLYSWTYTCLASKNMASTRHSLTNLGEHLTVLRTGNEADEHPPRLPARIEEGLLDLPALIAARSRDGYTLARHQTVTGEVTAAIVRGPLVPTQVKHPLPNITMQSNFGNDLAIFDPKLKMMDTTYSNAWQLGRTMAMADNAFCAALSRLRKHVHAFSLDAAKREVHSVFGDDGHGSRHCAAGRMVDLLRDLDRINEPLSTRGGSATTTGANRWPMAVETDGTGEEEKGQVMKNEHNTPVNPDYAVVYSWVLDKVHLANVPAQYLLPNPAFLPQETLRFFFLDANWVDALIDGALSLANHWGAKPEEDTARTAIKEAINKGPRTPDETLGGRHVQMPQYGFLLRSHFLTRFPDLAVEVTFSETLENPSKTNIKPPANTPAQQGILVQKRIAPDTMYILFDAAPPDLQRIAFTMPPHQRCFKVGHDLTADELTITIKKINTTASRPEAGETLGERHFKSDGTTDAVFDWKTRTLNPAIFSKYLVRELRDGMKEEFEDKIPTSAVTALQLNEGILQLDIGDVSTTSVPEPIPIFQLSAPTKASISP